MSGRFWIIVGLLVLGWILYFAQFPGAPVFWFLAVGLALYWMVTGRR
jgi:hypothetical protein